jgi:hypothetical protein
MLYLFGFGSFFAEIISEIGDFFPIGGFTAIFIVLLVLTIGGGITTLVGASKIDEYGPEKAGTIVIVGSIIGGINWISLIGGILLKQAHSTSGFLAGNPQRGVAPSQPYYPQDIPQNGQKRFCRNCGKPFDSDARFCQVCGTEK